ncbi:hypothetical protein CC1G_12744 [Coprinopsis cinerea okayama7|uniref:Uncharacterized protein n=1 Tax=Coprinopsis cinerea (strain Okayama-7 / 130 / ATCC MYA-4618 / FGSC 9003) TaxID=240176 RepID=A8NZA9_COPC7|nr:hypothetical protein CC1G_12744 [Coprinopsis cinerea okayama7\|eukprot:XP_001837639.1 hypothetical protein CC1G_12744 [Coprinopsis cinerea okayama7\
MSLQSKPVYREFVRYNKEKKMLWTAADAIVYYIIPEPLKLKEVASRAGESTVTATGKDVVWYWVATSPNMDRIPLVPRGWRVIQPRADGRYGVDDRTQYPIYFCDGFVYACCIPKKVPEMRLLRYTPPASDCPIVAQNGAENIRFLKRTILDEYDKYRKTYAAKAEDYHKANPLSTNGYLRAMVAHMNDVYLRLETCGMTYKEILLYNAEFQAACLDIHGWLDYTLIFGPRARKPLAPDERPPEVDDNRLGCFTEDFEVACQVYRMGIPVYYLRPSYTIMASGDRQISVIHGEVAPMPPLVQTQQYAEGTTISPYPPVAEGPPGPWIYQAQQRLGCSMVDLRLPSARGTIASDGSVRQPSLVHPALQPASTSAAVATSQTVGPIRKHQTSHRTSPYPQVEMTLNPPKLSRSSSSSSVKSSRISLSRSSSSSSVSSVVQSPRTRPLPPLQAPQLQRFKDITLDFWPPSIPSWVTALNAVDTTKPRYPREGWKLGFGVPDPWLFTKEKDREVFVIAWLLSRGTQLGSLFQSSSQDDAPDLTNAFWKGHFVRLRNHLRDKSSAAASSSTPSQRQPSSSNTKAAERTSEEAHFIKLLSIASSLSSVSYGDLKISLDASPAELQKSITPSILSEVVWEIHEVCFRLELLYLDRTKALSKWPVAAKDAPKNKRDEADVARSARDIQVRRCFGLIQDEAYPAYFLKQIPNENMPWASDDHLLRRLVVNRLAELMQDWEGCPKDIKMTSSIQRPDVDALESKVLKYYCATFFEEFGRAPIAPRRLPPASLQRKVPLDVRPYQFH